ncbi:hypothetical protein V1502_10980 [Bacillus sp. SCS-153A]|uniref:hypothetical protein n=1 Tax=Rossellomorea sedimentorum TaxID=3115294 RepID=UPI003906854B
MRVRYFNIVMVFILIIVIVFGFQQYLIKQRYESYLSLQVANDMSKLYSAVFNNKQIYEKIISSETISLKQAEQLYNNNYSIVRVTQEYQELALQLKRVEMSELGNLPASNAGSIAFFFRLLIWDIAGKEGISDSHYAFNLPYELPPSKHYKLESEELGKIVKVKELNDAWTNAFVQNIEGVSNEGKFDSELYYEAYREKGITHDFWSEVVKDMDIKTDRYLKSNNHIGNIKSLLY